MTFDLDNLDDLIDYLEEYKNGLDDKARLISERLADVGITIAQRESGNGMGKYLIFAKQLSNDEVIFYGTETGVIHVTWDTKDGERSADISPLLMCEFGAGQYANNPFDNLSGIGGQGTFPNQTHAFDPNGWNYHNSTGWHHSNGLEPNQPMYKAYIEMLSDIVRIAREVFHVG